MYITAVEKVLLFIDFFFSSSSITRDPVSMSLSAALTVGKLSPSFLVSSIPASLIKLNYEFIYSILYISNFYIFITHNSFIHLNIWEKTLNRRGIWNKFSIVYKFDVYVIIHWFRRWMLEIIKEISLENFKASWHRTFNVNL